jgi:hypothetical protein
MTEALRNSTPADRLRFAIGICPIVDKGGEANEAFAAVVKAAAKDTDPMVETFKALGKEDRFRTVAKILALIEQDKLGTPRRAARQAQNGETSITDLVLNAIQASKTPLTRVAVIAKVKEVMPDVSETTVRSIISAKKEDGTLRHHEEEHAYSMA